jgi:hypothetical protein
VLVAVPLSAALATVVCSRTRAAALPTDRQICNARVPQAVGQSFDWLVPAEAEVLGARVADRPTAFHLAELKQRASASAVDGNVFFGSRLRSRERRRHLMLGEDVPARTTALRVTPISRAIWPHESPAWRRRFSSSMRSELQIAQFADMLMALLGGWLE